MMPTLISSPLPPTPPAAMPWRILVVDDEAIFRESFEFAMRGVEIDGHPIEATQAASGSEAIEILRGVQDGHFALVVVDVVMEDTYAGIRVIREMRETLQFYSTQVAVCTGNPGFASPLSIAAKLDINDYRVKAKLDRNDIICMVYTAVRAYKLIHRIESHSKELQSATGAINAVAGLADIRRISQESADRLRSITKLHAVEILVRKKANSFATLGSSIVAEIPDQSHRLLQSLREELLVSPARVAKENCLCLHQVTADLEFMFLAVGQCIDSLLGQLIETFAGSVFTAIWGANISEQSHAHQKLAAIGNFAGSLVHDIKNAQTILQASSIQLKRACDPDRVPSREMVAQCVELIDGACSRIDAGMQYALANGACQNFEASSSVSEVLQPLITPLRSKECRIKVEIAEVAGPRFVACAPAQLTRVLDNLIANAVVALNSSDEQHPRIEIRIAPTEGHLTVIEIDDNGPGIPAENQERIFLPFFSTNEGKSRGLGLAICDAIVGQVGGKINVDSVQGAGTRFTLVLPSASPSLGLSSQPAAVLLVEPDDRQAAQLKHVLKNLNGMRANSAGEAIKVIGLHPTIDQVWMDCSMGIPDIRRIANVCRKALPAETRLSVLVNAEDTPAVESLSNELKLEVVAKSFLFEALTNQLSNQFANRT